MSHVSKCALLASMFCLVTSCTAVRKTNSSADPKAVCESKIGHDERQLLAQEGLTGTSVFFPSGEIRRQVNQYPGSICPDRALRIAVRALLNDGGSEALKSVHAEVGLGDCDARCYFNRRTSLFGVVAASGAILEDRLLPASPGEGKVEDFWTFYLSVPDLSEHGYWALVARDGSGARVVSAN